MTNKSGYGFKMNLNIIERQGKRKSLQYTPSCTRVRSLSTCLFFTKGGEVAPKGISIKERELMIPIVGLLKISGSIKGVLSKREN